MLTCEQATQIIEGGGTIANIGQLDAATRRELDRMVRRGVLAKWRGHWFPIEGAPYGMGPLKTCYGPVEARDYWATFGKIAA